MNNKLLLSLCLFTFLFINVVYNLPSAHAYVLENLSWYSKYTIGYQNKNMTTSEYTEMDKVMTNIRDCPIDFGITKNANNNIWCCRVYQSTGFWYGVAGFCDLHNDGRWFVSPVKVYINEYYTNGMITQNRQSVMSHEVCHGLGLAHSSGGSLMGTNAWTDYKIFTPVFDDIKGLQAIYGSSATTAQWNSYTTSNGHITWGPTNGYVENLWISPSGVSQSATCYESRTVLPSSGTMLMICEVQPSTSYKFATGIFKSQNPSDRMMSIEYDSDYFKLAKTSGSVNICQVYFPGYRHYLILVVQNGLPAYAYVYRADNGAWQGGNYLSLSDGWATSVHFSNSVWTDSSSNPSSNYNVYNWYNIMR